MPDVRTDVKVPNVPSDMCFDRKKGFNRRTWLGFRRHIEIWIANHTENAGWTAAHSKRLLYLALGETEQLMVNTLFTNENINNVVADTDFGTLEKMLLECDKIFQPTADKRMSLEIFYRCVQGDQEIIDVYLSRLKSLYAQAHAGKETERKDLLVTQFIRGLKNAKARYAVNTTQPPITTDIDKARSIANNSVAAQLADTPLSKRDTMNQGLSSSNIPQNTALTLLQELDPNTTAGLGAYHKITSGTAAHDMNQTMGGNFDAPEAMEIGAMSSGMEDFEEDEEQNPFELLEGVVAEQDALIAALQSGNKPDISKMKCHYCDIPGHFIARCIKRTNDQRRGIFRGRFRGNFRGRSNYTNYGRGQQFRGSGYRGGNRGGFYRGRTQ